MIMRTKLRALIDEKSLSVGDALQNLESALANLDELLVSDYCWVAVDGESTSIAAIAKVRAAYNDMDDDEIGDRRAMPGCRGIVAVRPRVIAAAHRVNAAKVELKVACTGLNCRTAVKRPDQHGRLSWVKIGMHRLTVTALGRPNLNLFAAYRKIPILTGRPSRVGFTVSRTYTIYSTPREVIANRLRRRVDAESVEDLLRVQRLPQSEATLALLTIPRPFPFAGVWFDGFDAQGRCYLGLSTPMPILFLAAGATPTVSYAPAKAGRSREQSARAVCPEPYLKTMRVHRYFRYMNEAETRRT